VRLRTALLLATTGMALVLVAGTALAQALNPVDCNTDPGQECRGTNDPDLITGSPDIDLIFGLRGGDSITGAGEQDKIDGGGGNDTIDGGEGRTG
jgi:Ca2+-binding RTX toxin-like protein